MELLDTIFKDTNLNQIYPILDFLPINFLFLSPVLFYLYAWSLMKPLGLKKYFWLFIPAIIEFIIFTRVWLLSPSTKDRLYDTHILGYYGLGVVYAIIFAALTVRLINRHQREIMEHFFRYNQPAVKLGEIWSFFHYCFVFYVFVSHIFSRPIANSVFVL